MNKKQISLNMISGVISGIIAMTTGFLLTPYLTRSLGDEAYGYIGLANNFISCATVFTIALNSMANRFILIAVEKGDDDKVNEYFSSLLTAGLVLAGTFMVIGTALSFNVESMFKVSLELVTSVKISFFLSVVNFSTLTVFSVFGTYAYVKNRLDISAGIGIIANIIKLVFLILVFLIFKPKIYYVTLGALIYTLVINLGSFWASKKLLPNISIKFALTKVRAIKELVFAGAWNSSIGLIGFLMTGLDLALANWLLDGAAMGIISISAILSVACSTILSAVVSSFDPTLAKTYAEGNREKLHLQQVDTNRIICAIMFVPIAGVCTFSSKFYILWLPGRDSTDIMILSIITVIRVLIYFEELSVSSIRSNFYLFNNIKPEAISRLILSALNVPIVVLLVKLFDKYTIGIMIIVGFSTALYLVHYWVVVPMIAAKITGQKISEYYKMIYKAASMFITLIASFAAINYFTTCNNWIEFILVAGVTGMLGYIIMFLTALTKKEKIIVYSKIKKGLKQVKKGKL